jgi:hypothetical protein
MSVHPIEVVQQDEAQWSKLAIAAIESCRLCMRVAGRCTAICKRIGGLDDCVRACRQCAGVCCEHADRLAKGSHWMAEQCISACRDCATECLKHLSIEACVRCAEVCNECAVACNDDSFARSSSYGVRA